jgi:hypothetical protein
MKLPLCFLCNKHLVRPDDTFDGGYVEFAEYVEPEIEGVAPEDVVLDDPPGIECFCAEHLPAAQALSHLTSEEAILLLEQQFGKFEMPEEPEPPLTRWQRFYCWFWKHFI